MLTASSRGAAAFVSVTAATEADGDNSCSPLSRASMAEVNWRRTASRQGRPFRREAALKDRKMAVRVAESSVVPEIGVIHDDDDLMIVRVTSNGQSNQEVHQQGNNEVF